MDWDRSYYTDDANRGVDWTAAVGADDARCAKKSNYKTIAGERTKRRPAVADPRDQYRPDSPPPCALVSYAAATRAVETPWLCGADLSKGDAMGNRKTTTRVALLCAL